MKKTILLLLTSLSFSLAFSQKHKTFEIESDLMYHKNLGENGILFKTGKNNKNWEISYYDQNLELIWKKPIQSQVTYISYAESPIVSTKDGAYVYHLENKSGEYLSSSPTVLTQIDKSGNVKEKDLGKHDFNIASIICSDDKYLYVLGGGKISHSDYTNYSKSNWTLTTINHNDLTLKSYSLKLPIIPNGRENGSWKYVGVSDKGILLYSNQLDFEKNICHSTIATINPENGIVTSFIVDVKPKSFLAASNYTDVLNGCLFIGHKDYNETMGKTLGGAFCNFSLDAESNVVAFGLTGNSSFFDGKVDFNGYYLNKYNQKGEIIWSSEQSPDILQKDEKFCHNNFGVNWRSTSLRMENGALKFIIDNEFSNFYFTHDGTTGKLLHNKRVEFGLTNGKGISRVYEITKGFSFDDNWNILFCDNKKLETEIFNYKKVNPKYFFALPGLKKDTLFIFDIKKSTLSAVLFE